jgi:superfamily II DNA or RNA helicase
MEHMGDHLSDSPERGEPTEPGARLARALRDVVHEISERDFDLHPHQIECLQAILHQLQKGETEGYIEAATSSGKTLLEALVVEAALRAGLRVHTLASRQTSLNQLIGADGQRGIGRFTDIPPELIGKNYGTARANASYPCVASTYHGFLHEAKACQQNTGRLGDFDVLIADECHKSLGTETSRALYHYMPGGIKLGFSATPDYAEDRRSQEIYSAPWFEFPLLAAIETGIVAPVRPLIFLTDSEIDTKSFGDFTEKELAPLVNNPERNGLALQLAQDFVADGRQGIIACIPGHNNAHAVIMAQLLASLNVGDRQIVAADIGGHLSESVRDQRLQDFQNGNIDILTFTRAIEESWDSDKASFCINTAPTTSPVRTTQLLGRVIRPNSDGRESIYVDFVDDNIGDDKQQFTAFHALELEDIDIDRVLGWGQYQTSERRQAPRPPLFNLRPDLHQRLLRVQGKLVSQAVVGKARDPHASLKAKWDRKLAKEGMPAELPYTLTFNPKLAKQYQKNRHALQQEHGIDPANEAVAEGLNKLTKQEQRLVRAYGRRVLVAAETLAAIPDNEPGIDDQLAEADYLAKALLALDVLDYRTRGIVRMRLGFDSIDGKEMPLHEVGQRFRITRERVRQIEVKGRSLLHRLSENSIFAIDSSEPPKQYHRFKNLRAIPKEQLAHIATLAFPSAEELLTGDETQTPLERFRVACWQKAEKWYQDKLAELERRNAQTNEHEWWHREVSVINQESAALSTLETHTQLHADEQTMPYRAHITAVNVRSQIIDTYRHQLYRSPHNPAIDITETLPKAIDLSSS